MSQRSAERSGEEGLRSLASAPTTVEGSVSPFTSLNTSSADSLNGYGGYYDDDSTSFASPTSFSPHTPRSQTDSLARTPPRPVVASPIPIRGDVSKPTEPDHEAQLEEQPAQEATQLSAKSSRALSALPFNSSFFSYVTESLTSAELLLASKFPVSASPLCSTAPPGSRAPLPRAGSSPRSPPAAPASLSAVHETVPNFDETSKKAFFSSSSLSSSAVLATTQSTNSLPVPPPLESVSAMMTQVLPRSTSLEGQHRSLVSPPAATSSQLPLQTPRVADRLQDEERERKLSPSPATDLGATDTVSTLPLAELCELPLSMPLSSSSSFSALPSAASPPSALAASLDETHACASLSHLATSLLDADGAHLMADEPHARSCINTTALSWVLMPLPPMSVPKHRQQRGAAVRPPSVGGRRDTGCAGQGDGNPVEMHRWTRRKIKERVSAADETASVAERGMLAPAPLRPPSSSGRRRQGSKTDAKDADQGAVATAARSDAELAPFPDKAAELAHKERRGRLRGLAEPLASQLSASHHELGHLAFLPASTRQLTELCPRELAALAGDAPLSNLLAAGGGLGASVTPMAPAAHQAPAAPVPSQSQGQRLRSPPHRKAEVLQIAAAAVEGNVASVAGHVAIKASREMAETASAASTSFPLLVASHSVPKLPAGSAKLEDGGAGREFSTRSGTPAAPRLGAAGKSKASTSSPTPSVLKRSKSGKAPAPATEAPYSTGNGSSGNNHSAATQAVSSVTRAAVVDRSPLQAWRYAMHASATSSESGRPCLWIELAEGYQEAHGTLLRQVLVFWGCLHVEGCASSRGGLEWPIGASSRPTSSTSDCLSRKRTRGRKDAEAGGNVESAQLERPHKRCNNGLVVLLCPSRLPMAKALRWWTQHAHVEHSFMPPLLSVAVSADSPPGAVGLADQALNAPRGVPALEEELEFFKGAIEQASLMYCTDAARSLAVSCTTAGHTAFSQLLPTGQVFESLQICADLLGPEAGFPPTSVLAEAPLEEGTDVGSLTAVLAVTPHTRDAGSSSAEEEWRAASLQDRCFAELSRWNGLAAMLQRQPRRPQLILRRVRADPLHRNGCASKGGEKTTSSAMSLSALVDTFEGALSASSVAGTSLLLQQRQLWVTYGLVLPATRNKDTFACSARREARVLASQPPPVTLAPAHLSALYLFGRTLFKPDNYATAVNVVESYAQMSERCLSDYLSGYSCVATGPLRYAVSATIRRYLQVRVLVALAPLLALVNEGAATQQRVSTTLSASCACASLPSSSSWLAPVVLLARSEWRSVVPSLSCTCNPRAYEQVPHTNDGVKVCRHLAELFHYFTTRQFSVVGHQAAQKGQPLQQPRPRRAIGRADSMPYLPSPRVPPCTTSLKEQQRPRRSSSNSSTDVLVNDLPLSALYTPSPHPYTDAERAARRREGGQDSESQGTDTESSAQPPTRCHPLRAGGVAARSPSTLRNAPRTRPSKKAQRSSTAAAGRASVTSSTDASAAGTDFHTQALQYALRLLHEHLHDTSGGKPSGGGAASVASGGAGDGDPVFRSGGSSSPASARKRARSGGGTTRETEYVRALRLMEQMLRNELR
ncbi:hypothetical protein CUR178_02451 [Leishmania enriettii]|uniref:SWIM-type domain-containing protein n=1 Tax=Leishmania enriettii TaxID=5663 RepID=A0A836KHQ2_LEIEN|nr:hypothetical protein CUR178_02451 [Leishmania enriettii]